VELVNTLTKPLAASTTTYGILVMWVNWTSPLNLNECPSKGIVEILEYAEQQYCSSETEDL